MTVIPHPPHSSIWPPVTFSSSPSWSFGWRVEDSTPMKRFKRNRSGYLTVPKKDFHGRNAGTAVFVQRGVLWRWWRNLTSKVHRLLFTSTVLETLDTPLYLDERLHGVRAHGTQRKTTVIAYAHVSILVTSHEDVRTVRDAIACYEKATGAT